MSAKQIYSVVNTIANNISYTGGDVVDVTSFVAFGENALSTPAMTESVYDKLYDLIGRTVIAIDEAEDDELDIVVDAFEYGSILQKLSFANQSAEVSSEWDVENPENPYDEVRKDGIVQEFFENYIPAFSWKDVSYREQLKEAFRTPEKLAGFTDALFTRMRNAYKIAKNGLSFNALNSFVGTLYATRLTAPNGSRRVRHLMSEFNTLYLSGDNDTPLTSDTSLVNKEYLEYIRKQIIKDKKNLAKMTKLYNSGTVERRTTDADARLVLHVDLTTSYDKYYGETFNENYIKLPPHKEVVNWGNATYPEAFDISLDGGATTTHVGDLIGVIYDKDAVVATMDKSRFVNMYDEWNDRNIFKLTAIRRYINDVSENGIIYLND